MTAETEDDSPKLTPGDAAGAFHLVAGMEGDVADLKAISLAMFVAAESDALSYEDMAVIWHYFSREIEKISTRLEEYRGGAFHLLHEYAHPRTEPQP